MSEDKGLTLAASEEAASALVPFAQMPVSLQIFFNPLLFDRCKQIAHYLSKAEGFAPAHLIGKPEACFAIVSRSLAWKLDPYAVANATYQTPNKQVGFLGSLCQAIIENSGRLVGGVQYKHFGDWSKIQRRFKVVEETRKGRDNSTYKVRLPVPTWADEDEEGIGVTVIAQIKGETEPRTLDFHLAQAYPRNSTLWVTDPKTQIQYTAIRRFATSVAPSLFMGVPFESEDVDWAASLKDVTPARPRREDFGLATPHENAAKAAPDGDAETAQTETSATADDDLPNHVLIREEPVEDEDVEQDPERVATNDPEPNASEGVHPVTVQESKGEDVTRRRAPAVARGAGPEHERLAHREDPDRDAGEAGGSPAPSDDDERDDFWRGQTLEIKPYPNAKTRDRTDWKRTQAEFLYRIGDAAWRDEVRRLQADNQRTLAGMKLAYIGLYDEVIARIAAAMQTLPLRDAGGTRLGTLDAG